MTEQEIRAWILLGAALASGAVRRAIDTSKMSRLVGNVAASIVELQEAEKTQSPLRKDGELSALLKSIDVAIDDVSIVEAIRERLELDFARQELSGIANRLRFPAMFRADAEEIKREIETIRNGLGAPK